MSVIGAEHDGVLDRVFELPHVARPVVGAQAGQRLRREAGDRSLGLVAEAAGEPGSRAAECPRAARAAPASRARRRSAGSRGRGGSRRRRWRPRDRDWSPPPGESRPSPACVPPTRSNSRSCSTRSSFACSAERELADLVQEHRAALGGLEPALLLHDGAGERAALVAEQLALEQRLGDRRAVDGDKRPIRRADCCGGSRGRPAPCRSRSRR